MFVSMRSRAGSSKPWLLSRRRKINFFFETGNSLLFSPAIYLAYLNTAEVTMKIFYRAIRSMAGS